LKEAVPQTQEREEGIDGDFAPHLEKEKKQGREEKVGLVFPEKGGWGRGRLLGVSNRRVSTVE